jgi:hypothetical protein
VFLANKNYRNEFKFLLVKGFIPAGYKITKDVTLDPLSESSKYAGLVFSLDERKIVYRKGKVTTDRPGAFLAIWQRPFVDSLNDNKPIPLTSNDLDYLFVQVASHPSVKAKEGSENSTQHGMFIFPIALLLEKGIVSSANNKGKTGFRVFPPWSQNRGKVGTKVFSESGKKTQRWQLPYFVDIDENGLIKPDQLDKILSHKNI